MSDRPIPPGISIRSIGPGDQRALERFYTGLSVDAMDARFHGAAHSITRRAARSFCGPDHRHREGLVAVEHRAGGGDVIVGHICLEPIDESAVEMAVAVADAWQHRGIGRALLTAAIDWATERRFARVLAEIRWSNPAIMGLLRSVQRPMTLRAGTAGDLEAVIDLGQTLPAAA
jgi:acetyltransferase